MPTIKYEVTLSPEAQRHPTAFAPVPASKPAVYSNAMAQGWTVTGQPGTRRIAAPYGDVGVPSGPGSPLPAGSGGSRYAPPFWFPSLYYARQVLWGGIGGVMVYSDNAVPKRTYPAVPTSAVPGMRPRRPVWLGGRQVSAGPNTPVWKRWGRRG